MKRSAPLCALLVLSLTRLADAAVQFEDVTQAAGLVVGGEGLGSGSAWRDFNGDGRPDVFVGNHYFYPALFKNLGNGSFANVTTEVLVRPDDAKGIWGDKHGAAWADFDNDGDRDLVVLVGAHEGAGSGAKQLYVRDGEQLVDHAKDLGIDYPLSRARTPTWVDYDNDGMLDLFVGAVPRPDGQAPPTLFHQNPVSGMFEDVRAATGFKPLNTLGIWISDLNRDGRMDILYVGKKDLPKKIKGTAISVIATTQTPFREITPIRFRANFPDLAVADFDGDLRPDIFVANNWEPSAATPFGHALYLNTAARWIDRTAQSGINAISRPSRPSAIAADFDNDMDVDVFLNNGSGGKSQGVNLRNVMLWNNGDGTFTADDGAGGAVGGIATGWGDSASAADYDSDGFIDLLITYTRAPAQLYRNKGNGNHWLEIDLRGTRSNRDAIGAQVFLTAGGISQLREQTGGIHRYWSQDDQRIHFGLAASTPASGEIWLGIVWPSGAITRQAVTEVDKVITVIEPAS